MKNAKEIAAARFAAGEISDEEYKKIVEALDGQKGQSSTKPTIDLSEKRGWVGWAIGIGIGILAIRLMTGGNGGAPEAGLHINNLRSNGLFGDLITGQIINEGSGSNVWFWIEVAGTRYCPRRVYIPAGSAYNFEMNCYDMIGPSSQNSKFRVQLTRNPDEWLQTQATSL